jgi:hypothetical protein
LQHASEHVPIRIDLQLPPRLGVVSAFDLGTVIVGGGVPITITNIAMAPAAPLHYSLAATTGFSAPGGSFTLGTGPVRSTRSPPPRGPRATARARWPSRATIRIMPR